jgi:hypothetical protein
MFEIIKFLVLESVKIFSNKKKTENEIGIILAVEHLVREDYKIEAMDRVEAYLDTLLMRMQLIKDRPYVEYFHNDFI